MSIRAVLYARVSGDDNADWLKDPKAELGSDNDGEWLKDPKAELGGNNDTTWLKDPKAESAEVDVGPIRPWNKTRRCRG